MSAQHIERRWSPRTSAIDQHFDKQPEGFKERHRQRLELEAQRDSLCSQLSQLYRDVRVVERGVAEIEKKLEVL